MNEIPMEYGLILAGILFMLGLISVLIRRNIIFMLISVEIMLNAAGLAFIVAGSRWAHGRRAGDVHLHPDDGSSRSFSWPCIDTTDLSST